MSKEKCLFCYQNPISAKSIKPPKCNIISVLRNNLNLSHEDLEAFDSVEEDDVDKKLCFSCHTNIVALNCTSREIQRLQLKLEETKRKMLENRIRGKRFYEEGKVEFQEETEMEEDVHFEDDDMSQEEFHEQNEDDDKLNAQISFPAKGHGHGIALLDMKEELEGGVKVEIEEDDQFEDDPTQEENEDNDDKQIAQLPATRRRRQANAPAKTTELSPMVTFSNRRGVVHIQNHEKLQLRPGRKTIPNTNQDSRCPGTSSDDSSEDDDDDDSSSSSSSASEQEEKNDHEQDKIMSQSSSLRKLSCPICNSPFSNFRALQNFSCHLESCIANTVASRLMSHLKCSICKEFKCHKNKSKEYLEHMLMCCEGISNSRPIPWRHGIVSCSSCRWNLLSFSDLAEHIYMYHQHEISCTRCPMRFKRSFECYRVHWKRHHGNLVDKISLRDRWKKSDTPKYEPNIPWFCPVRDCYQMLESEEGRDHHVETEHENTPYLPLKIFKCFMCRNTYYTREELRIHHVTIHQILLKKPPLKCDVEDCSHFCLTKKELEDHKRSKHGINLFKCSICGESYTRKDTLQRHLRNMHEADVKLKVTIPKVSCSICHQLMKKEYVQKHMERYHGNKEKLKCDECDAQFVRSDHLDSHKERMHGDQDQTKSKQIYACTREGCTKICKTQYLLDIHMAKVHDTEFLEFCKECGKGFYMKGARIRHEKTHQSEDNKIVILHPCPVCKREFRFKRRLQNHLRCCTLKSLKCLRCNAQCATFDELQQHKKTEHWQFFNRGKGNELKVSCSVCDQIFNNRTKYSNHMRLAHVRKLCEICGARLNPKPSSVNYHMAKKHGIGELKEKSPVPVCCDVCGKTYRNKNLLRVHIRVQHEKNFTLKCDLCGNGVQDKKHLRIHKGVVHNIREFKCDYEGCTKAFWCGSQLLRHKKFNHEGQVRPRDKFCQFCGKAFSLVASLRLHEQAMHTNRESKPFKCNLCGKSFATDHYLDYHIRGTHKIKRVKDVKNKC